ncbi:two-component system, NtrC family, nitrogen regulation sensor histidine kinase NtrY [Sphingomonas gellani]|uniref:histidine kinase n=1 Tax=Sphingomonas gellani TaxID=1166340 RepID=A0A1H7ZQB5_9SPHN|nr:ATP-binding protein [Sphingomonas gellani]SEM60493.1 two-component system, NtrC family, nitrogen regulation sensor histidine kinase NtrY [Sphingomonas gellani]
MIAVATPEPEDLPPARLSVTPALELAVLAGAAVVAFGSYRLIAGNHAPGLLTPPLVALLLVANLVPAMVLIMLLGRRVARRRARLSPVGGNGQLHVRLVALFSAVAAVPLILVTICASLLFQYGVEFWYSDRARGMLENAQSLARESYQQMLSGVDKENVALATDVSQWLTQQRWDPDNPKFISIFLQDIYQRSLSEAVLFHLASDGEIRTDVLINPYARDLSGDIDTKVVRKLTDVRPSVASTTNERIQSIALVPGTDYYVYSSRRYGAQQMTARMNRAQSVIDDYHALQRQSRSVQLLFNAALLIMSLLIIGVVVWIALGLADRLVRPVGELVDAARRVAAGDLSASVSAPKTRDEVGTLASAFNQMTGRLREQNTALVSANDQLDSRRALIEAVMAGVSAGVVATAEDRTIRIANASAGRLIGGGNALVGRPLGEVSAELDTMVVEGEREAIVAAGDRTLAVRVARTEAGPILTFDDITQQQQDQRRAAWADVARRIAHEIKNPLTPIQLAAERLQRRYGGKVDADDTIFARLTETIIRQVGDLRRMVDEFSSFARMPKPVFKAEPVLDTVRQAMFLHEVAHPGVRFVIDTDEPGPTLVCDRRQMGQAMTNLVKNAVEAIETKGEEGGEVRVAVTGGSTVRIVVEDSGVGLPAERERIVEPYMTTRARGTGLGLAIVKKIVEEHHGTLEFSDRPGGGTRVTLSFDADALAQHDDGNTEQNAAPRSVAQLAGAFAQRNIG